MSLNTMNLRGTVRWTWRVTTPGGIILIPDATIGEAIRKAGLAGPESVQPATVDEHLRSVKMANAA